ncbi:uncharacterized protein [Linepithema humile]|uniref:uncharacterized protein n=1 Tax=Linepithema humile TaxID=83485 RepID=UPI00351F5B59
MSILNNDKDKLHNMILDYVNRIQNAFSRPSLNAFFNITLISLKYLKEQQLNLPISDGDAKELLNSFCTYVNFLNPSDDNDPRHWDIGLYLTGINLYEYIHVLQPYYRTEKNYDIKGRTYQDGACNPLLSCAIVEFRDSSEITSSLEAIYKIGNLLGLTQEQSSSDSQKYVTWSKNSNKIEKLWETKTCLRDQAKTMISKPENINNDNAGQNLTIELAVFIDEAAYNKSMSILDNDEDKLHNIILAYVNRIQAAFNRPSLDVFMNITLIRLIMLREQPSNLPISDGNAGELLFSFCTYADSLNFPNDNNPHHWDIALYLTGIKLYENVMVKFKMHDRDEKNFQITGYTYFDSVCKPLLSCAIAEFRDKSEVEYPLTAIKMIGELLGLIPEQSSSNLERNITWPEYNRNEMETLWERKTCLRDQAKRMNFKKENIDNTQKKLIIELAVFFDEAAYHMYMPILDNDEDKLRDMILAYVNQIQALLHHSSFGVLVDISLVKLVIMDKQLSNLSTSTWDIGLYLTGINLYESEKERKHYSVVGSSFVNYSCTEILSCALVEISSTGPNAVSGFATSRAAAHEIGHLLGMKHDNDFINSTCAKSRYIMTDFQYLRGQVTWSECSRNITKNLRKRKPCLLDHTRREETENPYALGHSRYHDLPGREWTAKEQCELFLRDKDANVVTLHDICQVLQCETPRKNEYFFAGPALDGTRCALEKECRGGECVAVIEPPYIFPYCEDNNWSEWKEDSCKSSCLTQSKGVVIKRRFCTHGTYKTASCNGPYYDVVLCNDSRLCTGKRKRITEYATIKCTEYNLKVKKGGGKYFNYDPENGPGWKVIHDKTKPWIACTVYCRRIVSAAKKQYEYVVRLEMLDLDIDPYFPDGTRCHYEDGQNYYCLQHYCLPKNYSIQE